jgi:hypothetical protein
MTFFASVHTSDLVQFILECFGGSIFNFKELFVFMSGHMCVLSHSSNDFAFKLMSCVLSQFVTQAQSLF